MYYMLFLIWTGKSTKIEVNSTKQNKQANILSTDLKQEPDRRVSKSKVWILVVID